MQDASKGSRIGSHRPAPLKALGCAQRYGARGGRRLWPLLADHTLSDGTKGGALRTRGSAAAWPDIRCNGRPIPANKVADFGSEKTKNSWRGTLDAYAIPRIGRMLLVKIEPAWSKPKVSPRWRQ
jgi:hypothetical protein